MYPIKSKILRHSDVFFRYLMNQFLNKTTCIATLSFQIAYSRIIEHCKNIENFCQCKQFCLPLSQIIITLTFSISTLAGSDAAMRPNAIVRSSASLQIYNANTMLYCSIHCKVLQVYCIVSIISWFVTTFSHQSLRR